MSATSSKVFVPLTSTPPPPLLYSNIVYGQVYIARLSILGLLDMTTFSPKAINFSMECEGESSRESGGRGENIETTASHCD